MKLPFQLFFTFLFLFEHPFFVSIFDGHDLNFVIMIVMLRCAGLLAQQTCKHTFVVAIADMQVMSFILRLRALFRTVFALLRAFVLSVTVVAHCFRMTKLLSAI
jgi:hypothetical protein